MLGLGNSICASHYSSGWSDPASTSNLAIWLKFNTNITSDQDASQTSHDHSTDAGNLADTDRINAWNAFGDTSINATQSTFGDKPLWETDSADLGGLKFAAGIKYMDFSTGIDIAADTDFSVVMRVKVSSHGGAFLGSTEAEFIKTVNDKRIQVTINGVVKNFEEASDTIATDTYYTFIFSRTNGATGNLNVYVNGGSFSDKDWDAAENHTNTANFVINNLGSRADDTGNFQGFIKDAIVYNGTALTADERALMYTYIDAQE